MRNSTVSLCGEHGSGAIDLVMKIKGIGFTEAMKALGGVTQATIRGAIRGCLEEEVSFQCNHTKRMNFQPSIIRQVKRMSSKTIMCALRKGFF